MALLADARDLSEDAKWYNKIARTTHAKFQETFLDETTGLYRNGFNTERSSIHANLFPLAFDLVPEANRKTITDWLVSRGMACSVYAALYLMEALFENSAETEAIDLMTAHTDRSWHQMIESGTTITWEAWDQKYKPNQDWNHAWGAAPANSFPRYVLGVRAQKPGWQTASTRPHLGGLSHAKGKVPTPRGPIFVEWKNADTFELSLKLPQGVDAEIAVPNLKKSPVILVNGKEVAARPSGDYLILKPKFSGEVELILQ